MSDHTFALPDLGEGLTEAEIVTWLVAEGDVVGIDQVLVEVETAKSVVEVPSPYAGRVSSLHAAAGETVAVGKPLVTVTADDETGSGNVLIGYGTSESAVSGRRRRPRVPMVEPRASASVSKPTVVSPLVRRMARDGGIDLDSIHGSGADGLITKADVVRALAGQSRPEEPAGQPRAESGERRTPLGPFRKTAAAALSRSRAEIPEATVWVDVDATPLWDLRASDPDGPGLLAYLARFVVAGLREYPVFNSRLDTERDELVEYDHVHLGLAVQGDRGLVAPAVMGADAMTTEQLDDGIRSLTARAREGRATAEELDAATFTLNNYGGFRVDGSAAIINHPQVAILGFGRIIDRPWVVGSGQSAEIVPRKITQMSFVFDHRVSDGGAAAGFMRVVADAIENPAAAIRKL